MKRILTLLLLTLLSLSAMAQKLTVETFEQSMSLDGKKYVRLDANGDACALIKVQLALPDAIFEGNVVGNVAYNKSEYWVYMYTGSTKMLTVKADGVLPLKVYFPDYGIDRLEGKTTYVMTLLAPQYDGNRQDNGMRYLSMTVKPSNASIRIDGQEQVVREDGTLMIPLPKGQHRYEVSATGYIQKEGIVNIGDQKESLKVTLDQVLTQLTVTCPTDGVAIYVNDMKMIEGNRWTGSLPSSTYVIEARKSGYSTQSQVIYLLPNQPQNVSLPGLSATAGTLSVSYSPENAEVWLDGKLLGTSPDFFHNITVGNHQIELRKDGYASEKKSVMIEAGKTVTLNGSLVSSAKPGTQSESEIVIDYTTPEWKYLEGKKYFDGKDAEKDYGKAFDFFRHAAKEGHAGAQAYLSECYAMGYGVTKDSIQVEHWSRLSADQGNAFGQNNLAWCYMCGWGVPKDSIKALSLFRLSAEQGFSWAQNRLGLFYLYGQLVEKNYDEAIKWLRLSADQDFLPAQYNLARAYEQRAQLEDFDEALIWLRKAAEQGNEQAKKELVCLEVALLYDFKLEKERILKSGLNSAEKRLAKKLKCPKEMLDNWSFLVYLILHAKSLKTDKEKQSYFDTYNLMNYEHLKRLESILSKEYIQLRLIEERYRE